MASDDGFDYDLFISYTRDPDYRLARELESTLESFHTIEVSGSHELRPLQVCRDGGDFSLGARERAAGTEREAEMAGIIRPYLARSRKLLVLCSARAARSVWVKDEIEWFLELRGPESIALAVTEGHKPEQSPEEIFPEPILRLGRQRTGWYDFRGYPGRAPKGHPYQDFDEATVQLAADLNGTSAGTLFPVWQRERRNALRRRRRAVAAAGAAILALTVLAGILYRSRSAARYEQAAQLAEDLANRTEALSTPGPDADAIQGFHLAVNAALASPDGHPRTPYHVARVFHLAVSLPTRIVRLRDEPHELRYAVLSPDLRHVLAMNSDYEAGLWDLTTGERQSVPFLDGAAIGYAGDEVTGGPGYGVESLEFSRDGSLAKAVVGGDRLLIWEVAGGRLLADVPLDDAEPSVFFSADGNAALGRRSFCDTVAGAEGPECCRVVLWQRAGTTVPDAELSQPCADVDDSDPQRPSLIYRGRRPVFVTRPGVGYDGQHREGTTGEWVGFGMAPDGGTIAGISRTASASFWIRSDSALVSHLVPLAESRAVAVRLLPSGESLLVLTADGRVMQRSLDGSVLWSAAVGARPETELTRGGIWTTPESDVFVVTYATGDEEEWEPGWVDLWKVGEAQPRKHAIFAGGPVADLVLLPDGEGGIARISGEEEYDYLESWSFARPARSGIRNLIRLRYGGLSRDGRVLLEGDASEIQLLDAATGEQLAAPFPFDGERGVDGTVAMAILGRAHGLTVDSTGVHGTLAGGRPVRLERGAAGSRLDVAGRPLRAGASEIGPILSPDGRLIAALYRYRSSGGQIGALEDLVVREVESGRVLAAHYRFDVRRLLGFTADGQSLLAMDRAGGIEQYFVHGGHRVAPLWFAHLGAALTGTTMRPDRTLIELTPDEHRRVRDELRSELVAASAAGDAGARFLLSRFFGPG